MSALKINRAYTRIVIWLRIFFSHWISFLVLWTLHRIFISCSPTNHLNVHVALRFWMWKMWIFRLQIYGCWNKDPAGLNKLYILSFFTDSPTSFSRCRVYLRPCITCGLFDILRRLTRNRRPAQHWPKPQLVGQVVSVQNERPPPPPQSWSSPSRHCQ